MTVATTRRATGKARGGTETVEMFKNDSVFHRSQKSQNENDPIEQKVEKGKNDYFQERTSKSTRPVQRLATIP